MLLPDRFNEADVAVEDLLQAVDQAERGRGLADVLPRRTDEYAGHADGSVGEEG